MLVEEVLLLLMMIFFETSVHKAAIITMVVTNPTMQNGK
ncbi:hypothetical protein GLYMA_17G227250v4 [Glycine max]|nr:hypothetical protein GLYMA_17G227250v4 [Glycine max]